jgi:hypothetical protein
MLADSEVAYVAGRPDTAIVEDHVDACIFSQSGAGDTYAEASAIARSVLGYRMQEAVSQLDSKQDRIEIHRLLSHHGTAIRAPHAGKE